MMKPKTPCSLTAQRGHDLQPCGGFDEINNYQMKAVQIVRPQTVASVLPLSSQPDWLVDNYLSLEDSVSQRVVSCQNITPSYYPNLSLETIGKRPVYSARQCEYTIPDILVKNTQLPPELYNKDYRCHTPYWGKTCR
jgi:hypothetical protein